MLLGLLTKGDFVSGQSRQEPPRQNPGGTQQRTNTEQRDTDQVPPSIIKKLPAEDIQQKPSDTWLLAIKLRSSLALSRCFSFSLSLELYLY
jgi:hypothetical protein